MLGPQVVRRTAAGEYDRIHDPTVGLFYAEAVRHGR